MKMVLAAAAAIVLAGCAQPAPQHEYAVAGVRQWATGTEVFVVNLKTGRVCAMEFGGTPPVKDSPPRCLG